ALLSRQPKVASSRVIAVAGDSGNQDGVPLEPRHKSLRERGSRLAQMKLRKQLRLSVRLGKVANPPAAQACRTGKGLVRQICQTTPRRDGHQPVSIRARESAQAWLRLLRARCAAFRVSVPY